MEFPGLYGDLQTGFKPIKFLDTRSVRVGHVIIIIIAAKAEPSLEIAGLCVQTAGSDSPLHSRDCKFASHYGKDYETEVHVNLDFRIRPINCTIAHALDHQFDDTRNGGRR